MRTLLVMLAPMAPHITSELWEGMAASPSTSYDPTVRAAGLYNWWCVFLTPLF
jgi:leucyl-tRNA synthetase